MRRFFSRILAFLRPGRAEAEMSREIEAHLALLEDDFIARGMTAAEARLAARRAFGRPDDAKDLHRASRSFALLDRWRLDFRLGLRLLLKHRGLSLAGGFAMAVAIALGASAFEIITEMLDPALPFSGGDRVVSIDYDDLDPAASGAVSPGELLTIDHELRTIEEIGAYRLTFLNLVPRSGAPEPVKVAEVTPSAFSIAAGSPLHGRPLVRGDALEGAPRVVVIREDVWRARFGADPDIVGRAFALGGTPHTVVGVMPAGFGFPYNHGFWVPLRDAPADAPLNGVFARLRGDATIEEAEAELTAVASRSAGREVRAEVVPFTLDMVDVRGPEMKLLFRLGQLLIGALALVVAVNLAILFYARTVTRLGEIAVRSALGASRSRILTQLFFEALALALTGAAAGIVLTRVVLGVLQLQASSQRGQVPFWIHFELSFATVVYAVALAVVAALIMGVVPGLKATGRGIASSLRDLTGRATRLGGVWTTLVVAQVAIAVAILPVSVYAAVMMVRMETAGVGFPAERFVVASVFTGDEETESAARRPGDIQAALTARLEAEPGVDAVTFTSAIPGFGGGSFFELEEGIPMRDEIEDASTIYVAPEAFEIYGAGIAAGRGFTAGDAGADTIVVNRRFASRLAPGARGPLGLRLRYVDQDGNPAGRWYEIVGIVDDFPGFAPEPFSKTAPTIYHAAAPGVLHPFFLSIRFEGDLPPGITERIRRIGAEIDPALQIRTAEPLATFYDEVRKFWRYIAWAIAAMTASVLLLSGAGIYAMMSFAVARRTREIGIRTALGATRGRLLVAIFGRALRQLGIGVLVGSLVPALFFARSGVAIAPSAGLLAAVGAIMLVVGVLAAIGPARRGLRIQPTEALRAE